MITSADIKTHSGIININNTLIQGARRWLAAAAIKIIRGAGRDLTVEEEGEVEVEDEAVAEAEVEV